MSNNLFLFHCFIFDTNKENFKPKKDVWQSIKWSFKAHIIHIDGYQKVNLFLKKNDDSSINTTKAINPTTSTTNESMENIDQTDLDNQTTAMSIGTTTDVTTDATTNTNLNTSEATKSDFTKVRPATSNTDNTTSTYKATITTPTLPITKATNSQSNNQKKALTIDDSANKDMLVTNEQAIPSIDKNTISPKEENPKVGVDKISTNTLLVQTLSADVFNQKDESKVPGSQYKNALDTYLKDASRLKKSTKNLRLGLGVYGGISKSTNELSSNDSIGAAGFTATRNNSEKQLETIHLGLGISVYSKNHLYLRSGAEYTRIASVFNASSSLTTVDTIYDAITEIIINTITGERDTIFGKVPVTTTTEFVKKHYNYIHLIDIPVIIGYQFEYEPWSVGIEGGIYANISAKYTGEITSTASDSFYDLEADEDKWFKTNIGIQPYIGLNAAYNVSDNFQIHFSPGFRFETLFSTDKNPVKEKHSTLGVRFGVRYIFD